MSDAAGTGALEPALVVAGLLIRGLPYAPQAAVIAETFPARLRTWSSTAIAIYVALSAVVSLTALWLLPDHSQRDLSEQ